MNRFNHNNINRNIYECNYSNDIQSAKDSYYKKQKDKTIDPTNKNIIAPYARNLINSVSINDGVKYNEEIMGPVVDNKDLKYQINETFDQQFELAKFVSKKPVANNELNNSVKNDNFSNFDVKTNDMTYGIVSKDDFTFTHMVPYTKARDKIINDENSFVSRSLATFTGVGLKDHKREVETFFTPEERQIGGPKVIYGDDDVRDRIKDYSSYKLNGAKPFEPEKVGPGLGLASDQQSLGGMHDTTRILPRNIDDLRAKNKQQVTYTMPVITGQMGSRAPDAQNIGEVRKYRPEKFKEYGVDEFRAGKAAVKAQKAPENIALRDGNRSVYKEVIGTANMGKYTTYNPENSGNIHESTRQQFDSLPIKPAGSGQFTKNAQGKDNSYIQYQNQRDTTNIEYFNNANNNTGYRSQLLDIAKPTIKQTTVENEYVGNFNGNNGFYQAPNDQAKSTIKEDTLANIDFYIKGNGGYVQQLQDIAKATIKQDLTQAQINQMIQVQGGSVASAFVDNAKATGRQTTNTPFNLMMQNNHYAGVSGLFDDAKATGRQEFTETQFNTNINSAGGQNIAGLFDNAKVTGRQEFTEAQFNTNINGAGGQNVAGLFDNAKATGRQEFTEAQFNTNINGAGGQNVAGLFDNAKATGRQEFTETQFNTNINGAGRQNVAGLFDNAKVTGRQEFTETQFNTNINGAGRQNVAGLFDNAKATGRQEFTETQFNTNINGAGGQNIVGLLDEAKATGRQEVTIKDYNSNMSLNGGYNTYLLDEAKATLKQDTMINNYISNSKHNTGQSVYLLDEAKATLKQDTMINDYISNGNHNTGQSVYLLDEAKGTLKQDTMVNNYVYIPGSTSINKLKTYQSDEAKATLKQDNLIIDHKGNVERTGPEALRSRLDANQMMTKSNREIVMKERAPTQRGISLTPDSRLMNVELKDNVKHNPLLIPNKSFECKRSNFEYSSKKNNTQTQNNVFDDEFLYIMGDVLTQNALVNNLVHQGNKNAEVRNMFTMNKS